jgi:hypothetical protein
MPDARQLSLRFAHLSHLAVLELLLVCPPLGRAQPGAPPAAAIEPARPPAPLHDCNGNGIEDMVDIALGTSSDADLDGVPDECQAHRIYAPSERAPL